MRFINIDTNKGYWSSLTFLFGFLFLVCLVSLLILVVLEIGLEVLELILLLNEGFKEIFDKGFPEI